MVVSVESFRLQSILPMFGRFALDMSGVFGLIFEVGRYGPKQSMLVVVKFDDYN